MPSDDKAVVLVAEPADVARATLIDVRRAPAFAQAARMLPGAVWRDPAELAQWAGEFDAAREIVVYCVHGHEVSQQVAAQLCARGLNARYLRGGFEAWQDAGLPLVGKPEPPAGDGSLRVAGEP